MILPLPSFTSDRQQLGIPYGQTPLHDAAVSGSAETVNALIDRGADPNARDAIGQPPLHLAAWWGNAGTVNALLDRGADGETPFDFIEDDSAWKGTDAYWKLNEGRFR